MPAAISGARHVIRRRGGRGCSVPPRTMPGGEGGATDAVAGSAGLAMPAPRLGSNTQRLSAPAVPP
jgi:hypothetical protein